MSPKNVWGDMRYLRKILTALALAVIGFNGLQAQDTLNITVDCIDGEPGEIICLPIIVENFTDILSLQLPIVYDPAVLRFTGTQNNVLPFSVVSNPGPSDVRYIWVDLNVMGLSLPDGSVIFEACFEIIGLPGTQSEVNIMNTHGLDVEASNLIEEVEVSVNPCTVNVTDPDAVGAYIYTCGSPNGVADGSLTIVVFGGTGPYTCTWTGPIMGSSTLTNSGDSETQSVPIGIYTVEVTDATGATFSTTAEIVSNGFTSNIALWDPSCYSFSNGRMEVTASMGAPPYGVVWRSLDSPNRFGSGFINMSGGIYPVNSLPGGTYEIAVSDDNGCLRIDTVMIAADSFNIVANITDATCVGAMNGSVDLVISGGVPNPNGYDMVFSWGGMVTADIYNSGQILDPGDYSITISDAVLQCDTVFSFTIGATFDLDANIVLTQPTCSNSADGEIMVTAQPVSNTNTYYLFDGNGMLLATEPPGNNSALFTGLMAGTYGCVLDDGTCQTDTLLIVLDGPDPIVISALEVTPTGCTVGSFTGVIRVEASGGTVGAGSDYLYEWTGGIMGDSLGGLGQGNYTVTVTDDNGCTASMTYSIMQLPGPQVDSIVATNVSCTNDPVTTLEVFFTPGGAAVTGISWRDSDGTIVGSDTILLNQTAGDTLDVILTDANQCFSVLNNYVVPGGTDMAIDSIRLESPVCPGDNNGQITVFVSGGVPPYTYFWSTGDTNTFNLLPGLTAGDYGVTVIDADSCGMVDTTFTLVEPPSIGFDFIDIDSAGCSTNCNGAATAVPIGGDPGIPFTFFWQNGFMETGAQSTLNGLCGGWITVTVTQDNLCFFTDSVFIPLPEDVSIIADTVADVSCAGSADGFIELSAAGGSGGYTFSWDGLPDGPMQSGLIAGTYFVTVSDVDMCFAVDSFEINEPDSIRLLLDSTTLTPIGCSGDSDGAVGFQVLGGTPGFEYMWSPNVSTGPLAQQLGPGTYEVTVTDIAGCTDTASYTLNEPEPLQVELNPVLSPRCVGETSEVSVASVIGGNGPYTFAINGGEQYPVDSTVNIPVGFYDVIVYDQTGCTDTTAIAITAPPAIVLEVQPEAPIVDLGDSVLIELLISNTQGPVDSIVWTHAEQPGALSCYNCESVYASNVVPVTYYVMVTDSMGCRVQQEIFVDVNSQRNVFFPNVFTPNNDGHNEDFEIFIGRGVTQVKSVRIFNRWGELMNEERELPAGPESYTVWNGEYKGKQMQPGVYIYVAEVLFADRPNDPIIFKGDVTLIR